MRWVALVAWTIGLSAGCETNEAKQETPQVGEPASVQGEVATGKKHAGGRSAPTPPPEALPIPGDYEARMRKSITAENYKAELKRLENALKSDEASE